MAGGVALGGREALGALAPRARKPSKAPASWGTSCDEIEIAPYSQGCPADAPTHDPALPEGEHPDPFVVADEFREVLDQRYRKVLHTPWLDVQTAGA